MKLTDRVAMKLQSLNSYIRYFKLRNATNWFDKGCSLAFNGKALHLIVALINKLFN